MLVLRLIKVGIVEVKFKLGGYRQYGLRGLRRTYHFVDSASDLCSLQQLEFEQIDASCMMMFQCGSLELD